jgi:hypothetical protein
MHGASAIVLVPGYGPVNLAVYVFSPEHTRTALYLAAYLYAREEAGRHERERAT